MILAYLSSDINTLLTIAQVCKDWLAWSRSHHSFDVPLSRWSKFSRLCRRRKASSKQLITELTIWIHYYRSASPRKLKNCFRQLADLPSLTTLRIMMPNAAIRFSDTVDRGPEVIATLLTKHLTSLKALSLHTVTFPSSANLLRTLASLEQLAKLELDTVSWRGDWDPARATKNPAPVQLKDISIRADGLVPLHLATWLLHDRPRLSGCSLPSLSLGFTRVEDEHCEDVFVFIRSLGPWLGSLELKLYPMMEEFNHASGLVHALEACQSLRHFTVWTFWGHSTIRAKARYPFWVCSALGPAVLASLETLTLRFGTSAWFEEVASRGAYPCDMRCKASADWGALDEQLAVAPRLQRVVVEHTWAHVAVANVKGASELRVVDVHAERERWTMTVMPYCATRSYLKFQPMDELQLLLSTSRRKVWDR